MSLFFVNVFSCLQKQIDVFKKELGRPAVCRQLDENSKKGGMTWEHCFEAVREFMVKEVAHVRSKLGKMMS